MKLPTLYHSKVTAAIQKQKNIPFDSIVKERPFQWWCLSNRNLVKGVKVVAEIYPKLKKTYFSFCMLPCNQNTGDIHLILKWLNKDRVQLLQKRVLIETPSSQYFSMKMSNFEKRTIPEYLIIPLVFHLYSNLSTSSSKVPCRGCNAS